MRKNSEATCFRISLAVTVLVGLSILAFYLKISISNNKERVLDFSKASRDSYIAFKISHNDGWIKEMPKGFSVPSYFKAKYPVNGRNSIEAYGKTYDFTITNLSKASIVDWRVVFTIPSDIFVNKSWNGSISFVQNHGKKIQEFNTMNISPENIQIDFYPVDELLLFPMERESLMTYFPSRSSYEVPVNPSSPSEKSYISRAFSMIIYSDVEIVDFSRIRVYYRVSENMVNYRFFWILATLLLMSGTSAFCFLGHCMSSKHYELIREHDREVIDQAILTFSNFIDAKDKYTRHHSLRVAYYSKMIAQKMNLSEVEVNDIFYIALLHDAGKVDVLDSILNKNGRLTDEEYSVIKTHSQKGGDILYKFTAIRGLHDGVLYHHERYDGKGYPVGLVGDEIPLVARIICVADTFDAMSSDRCYRKKLSEERIRSELVSNRGSQFDPKIVDVFLGCLDSGELSSLKSHLDSEEF